MLSKKAMRSFESPAAERVLFFQPFARIHTHEPSFNDEDYEKDLASAADAFDRLFLIKPNMTQEEIEESNAKREQLRKFCNDRPATQRSLSGTRREGDSLVLGQKRKSFATSSPLQINLHSADGSKIAKKSGPSTQSLLNE